jgi:hypothetical protein
MTAWWRFRCYLKKDGIDVIDEWYRLQPEALQAKFDTRMRYLQQQPRDAWKRPYFDTLGGACAGLGEVRFEWKNVQYRPIGFASGEMEFTLVFVAEEHEDKFVPRRTCKVSQDRKTETQLDRDRASDCEFE